jgi:FkbM family methyltransferase
VEALAGLVAGPDLPRGRVGRRLSVRCDLSEQIQRQIYFGLYEPTETPIFRGLVRPGDVVLDVGANVGYYTLTAAELCGESGQVHAFEPIRENCARIEDGVALNGLRNVTVNCVAVNDGAEAQITLYLRQSGGNSGWASIVPSPTRGNTEYVVPAISIDRYVAERGIGRVSLMKLDCEGAELLALRGARELLSSSNAPDLMCELSPFHLTRMGSSPAELEALILGFGYRLFEIGPRGLHPLELRRGEQPVNVYATKRDAAG